MADWTELPYDEAMAKLREEKDMTDDDFTTTEIAVATLAFTLSRLAKMNMLQWVLEKLSEYFAAGKTVEDLDASLDAILEEAISAAHVEQMVTLAAQREFGAGMWQYGTTGAAAGDLWGWQYETMHDDRVREAHADLQGSRFSYADGGAPEVFPPWEWGCRCHAVMLTNKQVDAGTPSDQLPESATTALSETDYASPALLADMPFRPDLSGFDPRLLAAFANDQAVN